MSGVFANNKVTAADECGRKRKAGRRCRQIELKNYGRQVQMNTEATNSEPCNNASLSTRQILQIYFSILKDMQIQ